MFNIGDQVPVILLKDVVGKALNGPPEQMAATGLKVGVTDGITGIVNVVDVAHCPAVGVNVYVVVAVLSKAGAHVPLMPLIEVVGKAARGSPEHIAATAAKVGVIKGLTVIVSVVVTAH